MKNKCEKDDFNKEIVKTKPVKLIKKSDTLDQNIFINQLGVISGVSINIATKIKERFSTLMILIEHLKENGNESLFTEKLTGKALSIKIYNALML